MSLSKSLISISLFSLFLILQANSEITVQNESPEIDLFHRMFPQSLPPILGDFLKNPPSRERLDATIFKDVSLSCRVHTEHWIRELNSSTWENHKIWAIHLFDAWGKFPEGILSGHVNAMGDYDECVQTKASDLIIDLPDAPDAPNHFTGKYCTAFISLASESSEKKNFSKAIVDPGELIELIQLREGIMMNPSIAVCFPSTCSSEDILNLMMNSFEYFNVSGLQPIVANCFVEEKPPFDAGDITMLSIIGVLVGLSIIGALMDILRDKSKKPSKGLQYILAFSFYTNTKKWLSTNSSGDNLSCIHGIRFFSTSWIILAHTWYMITFVPMWNMVDVKRIPNHWTMLTVLNGSIAVDTFFCMSGLLVAFSLLKMFDKSKGRLNIPMFYLHRYLRLTPTYAILVGLMATLFPYFGTGPYWTIIDVWADWCEKNWWTNLLYVNNFIGTDQLCQGEAWFLANDMQFYILSPFIIYPLWKKPKLGVLFLVVLTILSSVAPALLVWHLDALPTIIGTRGDQETVYIDIYIKPYARIQTYLVGIWVGYFLFKTRSKKFEMSKFVNLSGWALAVGSALSVLYGIYNYFDPYYEIPEAPSLIYAGLSRLAWGYSVGWMIFACCKGYGGFINSFLSWKVFMPLGRLTFCAYLVSLHIQMIFHLSFRQPISYSLYAMVNFFFAHMVMSFGLAFFCTIIFESPFMQVEKLIFSGAERPPRPPIEPTTPQKQRYGIFYNKTETIISTPIENDKGIEAAESNNKEA